MSTALIVVDVQNDFAHPDGNLYVADGDQVASKVNGIMEDFDVVVFTKDYHPPVTTHFGKYGGPWPVHCIGGTWGAEFVDELYVPQYSTTVLKGTEWDADGYSGFSVERDGEIERTTLDAVLKLQNVDTVYVAGIALDVCVKATCLDAVELGYTTKLCLDATAAVTAEGAEQALEELREAGVNFVL